MNDETEPELRDPLTYTSVGEWFADYRGRVPIEMAIALDRYMKRTGRTFAEAWTALRKKGAIIMVNEEAAGGPSEGDDHTGGDGRQGDPDSGAR
jgi:hypothetical protein